MRAKIPVSEQAFVGRFTEHHAFLLRTMLARIDETSADIAAVETRIEEMVVPFGQAMERLDEITGIGPTAAHVVIAEIGIDMSRFPTPALLCSWARFAPGIKESAGRKKGNGSTGHGNPYLARVLGEAAVAASRTNTFLGERYRRIARRRGKKEVINQVSPSEFNWIARASPSTDTASPSTVTGPMRMIAANTCARSSSLPIGTTPRSTETSHV